MKAQSYSLTAVLLSAVLLAGCAASPSATNDDSAVEPADHGAVEGAQEMPEAPLHLVTVDASGTSGMLDLLTDEETELSELKNIQNLQTEGRYLFADTGAGVDIVDSGMWSWNHTDHFHYYRGTPQTVGHLDGEGPAQIIGGPLSTAGSTGVYFPKTGRGILLKNSELAKGNVSEQFTTQASPHQGLLTPLGEGAITSEAKSETAPAQVQYLDAEGHPVDGANAPCANPSDATQTAAGLAIACEEGILVANEEQPGHPEFELVKYPQGTTADERVDQLEHRKARPVVAGLAGERGAWVINTRDLSMNRIMEDQNLLKVTAVGDKDGNVVAVDASGRVLVYSTEAGKTTGVSKPVLQETVKNPQALASTNLVVDAQRAYVNAPAQKRVFEIDFADSARIARTLSPQIDPTWMTQVGN
ncbi:MULTISPECIES: ABC transporter [Micrococcaceae]|uniref:ABC transporter n=1 Tax=Micrococcaceae TaxID=1268 RepID=UPI001035B82F|nr:MULTISPECIES: ABC transporter [Micrococcaceae]TAP28294.1 ABC transporter [Arthrobacter sp. S41]UXN32909.1 ABC transporter [Glutamicibacter sp. M10]